MLKISVQLNVNRPNNFENWVEEKGKKNNSKEMFWLCLIRHFKIYFPFSWIKKTNKQKTPHFFPNTLYSYQLTAIKFQQHLNLGVKQLCF